MYNDLVMKEQFSKELGSEIRRTKALGASLRRNNETLFDRMRSILPWLYMALFCSLVYIAIWGTGVTSTGFMGVSLLLLTLIIADCMNEGYSVAAYCENSRIQTFNVEGIINFNESGIFLESHNKNGRFNKNGNVYILPWDGITKMRYDAKTNILEIESKVDHFEVSLKCGIGLLDDLYERSEHLLEVAV